MTPDVAREQATVVLLQLCDSLFPVGAFAHSDGLETAVSGGRVSDLAGLRAWVDALLAETIAECEAPAVGAAHAAALRRDVVALAALDEELHAMRPSAAGRAASRTMGTRLLRTWQHIRPTGAVAAIQGALQQATYPVAFGIVCAASEIPVRATLESFMYTRLAATVSSAMRLMPLGQHDAHTLLAEMLQQVPSRAAAVAADPAPPRCFVPLADIAAMGHQYLHSRLFRS